MDFKMSQVTENALGEEDEDVDVKESSGREKPFNAQTIRSGQSAGSETSNQSAANKNDVSCFLDLLDNSRGSSSHDPEEACNRTGGAADIQNKQDMHDFCQSHSMLF